MKLPLDKGSRYSCFLEKKGGGLDSYKKYYSSPELKAQNKILVAGSCLPEESIDIDGCTREESTAIWTKLETLRRPDVDARLGRYLTAYYEDRRSKCKEESDYIALFSELHLSDPDSSGDVAAAVGKIILHRDQLLETLLKVPVPLGVIFKDPSGAMAEVYSMAPHKDPAFKELLTRVRSGSRDEVELEFSSMDSGEKAKRLSAGGGYLANELRRHCPDIAEGIINGGVGGG